MTEVAAPSSSTGTTTPRARFAADVGGTWLRLRSGTGTPVERRRAPSLLNLPGTPVSDLRSLLVEALCTAAPPGAVAAISFGAALDHASGIVYGSGPLWGDSDSPFDLLATLRAERPDADWMVVNDLTAALADFIDRRGLPGMRRIGYLTISSGIALRVADLKNRTIPIDEHGLQGEVGHLAAPSGPEIHDQPLLCECGVPGHVAAYSSGPGIDRIARHIGVDAGDRAPDWLPAALDAGDPTAQRVLAAAVAPIAGLLRTLWCVDPHLDLLGLGGGVVAGLGEHYRRELLATLRSGSGYADRGFSDAWLARRLVFCGPDDIDCLRGAERMREGALVVAA